MTFDIRRAIEAATAAYGVGIPKSIRKPTSGPCIHCQHDTDERDEGEWLHSECRDELVDEQRADDRHNDPRTGQAAYLNRMR